MKKTIVFAVVAFGLAIWLVTGGTLYTKQSLENAALKKVGVVLSETE
jgi:hypothetical protein